MEVCVAEAMGRDMAGEVGFMGLRVAFRGLEELVFKAALVVVSGFGAGCWGCGGWGSFGRRNWVV